MSPNILALLALALFPLVMVVVLATHPPGKGILMLLIAAELLLPPSYALPISPGWLSKWIVPGFMAGILAPFFARQRCPVQHELLSHRTRNTLAQVPGSLPLEELRAQSGNAGVVDAGFELRIRVLDDRGTRRLARRGT